MTFLCRLYTGIDLLMMKFMFFNLITNSYCLCIVDGIVEGKPTNEKEGSIKFYSDVYYTTAESDLFVNLYM